MRRLCTHGTGYRAVCHSAGAGAGAGTGWLTPRTSMDTMAPSIEEGLGLAQSDEDEPSRKEIGEGRERLMNG